MSLKYNAREKATATKMVHVCEMRLVDADETPSHLPGYRASICPSMPTSPNLLNKCPTSPLVPSFFQHLVFSTFSSTIYRSFHLESKRGLSFHLLQNLAQEILKAQSNVAIPVIIISLKHIRHTLQRDARLNKQVKAHDAFAALIVRAEQQLDKLRAESVTERNEGIGEFRQRDVAAAVDVEAVEESAPRGEEGPEAAEFLEANCAAAVRVEHANHHADSLDVEGGPIAVDKGRRELLFG